MMIAQDSGPPSGGPLSSETIERVNQALARFADAPAAPPQDLHAALLELAREARAIRMPPEQLLHVLKGLWYELPPMRSPQPAEERVKLLQRVVAMCIREYYSV
jgi:hypothetical protein